MNFHNPEAQRVTEIAVDRMIERHTHPLPESTQAGLDNSLNFALAKINATFAQARARHAFHQRRGHVYTEVNETGDRFRIAPEAAFDELSRCEVLILIAELRELIGDGQEGVVL